MTALIKFLMVAVAVALLWPVLPTLIFAGGLIWLAVCWHKYKRAQVDRKVRRLVR
jgi:hypothetical protein